jgi:hypothetical protein
MSSSIEVEDTIHIEMDRLRGRLLGLIESWGLDDRQESACKSTLKALSYDSEAKLIKLLSESA